MPTVPNYSQYRPGPPTTADKLSTRILKVNQNVDQMLIADDNSFLHLKIIVVWLVGGIADLDNIYLFISQYHKTARYTDSKYFNSGTAKISI